MSKFGNPNEGVNENETKTRDVAWVRRPKRYNVSKKSKKQKQSAKEIKT